jgi:hypothetical protein
MTSHSVDVLPTDTPTRPPSPRGPSTPILIAIVVAALLAAATMFVAVTLNGQASETQKNAVVSDTAPAVLTLDVLCKRTDQIGNDLRALGACGDKVDKAKSAVDGQPVPPVAQGLARDDVVAIVQAQIAGKVVTSDQVLTLITQVYNANRPANGQPGPAPSADAILAAVNAVCANDRCVGPKGDGASASEIAEQVADYCGGPSEPCRGAKGDTGQTGATGQAGQKGDKGDPGPTCEPGFHVTDAKSGDTPPQDIRVCVADAPPVTSGG